MHRPETNAPQTIYVKRQFFEMIQANTKTLEVRVGFPIFQNINVGDPITFSSGSGETVDVEITGIRNYRSLEELVGAEDTNKIAPGIPAGMLLAEARRFLKAADIAQHGLLVFEFKRIG